MINSNANSKKLCLDLLAAETEDDIIKILKKAGYWDNSNYWRAFGDNDNNWSAIGNQQGNAAAAIVEKFVNSIDAVLMRECLLAGIYPESNQAPKSINEAIERFFHIKNGNLANINLTQRRTLSDQIGFIATGGKQTPNYIVFDRGEGQSPERMPDTLLSLSKSNKQRIHFVQGKFNMGGTGVLPFCGKHNMELIISRRHPQITDENDKSAPFWGFTLVRREEPQYASGRRSSVFTYLAPDSMVPTFESETLEFPDTGKGVPLPSLEWGTVIKMYEYEMTGFKSTILTAPLYNFLFLLPKPGLPIQFYEKRGYKWGERTTAVMSGVTVELEEDRLDNIEDNFPTSHQLSVKGETMTADIYAFKKKKSEKYTKSLGIVFTINGQTHGSIPPRFFSSNRINMGYIADSILVVIEASNISGRAREDLFMNSRDRLRKGDLYYEIEDAMIDLLSNHQGLKELRERRRREAIDNHLSDSKPLQEVLENILKKSPTLEKLFIRGLDIGNPLKSKSVGDTEKLFEGKRHPTFFNILPKDITKDAHLNLRFRVQFQTDVVNDYFGRDSYPGNFSLYQDSKLTQDYILNLWNGTVTVTVKLPENVQLGQTLNYFAKVQDDTGITFANEFIRRVVSEIEPTTGDPQKPPLNDGAGKRPVPEQFALPQVTEIREEQWEDRNFDKYSALQVIDNGDKVYDFFINMDNVYLRNELKTAPKSKMPKLMEAQFKFALVLIGIAILQNNDEEDLDPEDNSQLEEKVFSITKSIAPIILPMIDSLGELKPEDIVDKEFDLSE
ncbi:MAG: hypothetical protein H0X30_25180 [Anaerolineae bacterium]|nr:hypothetical protein [Anaerolineae bacterium]